MRYSKRSYELIGFEKAKAKNKMYNALIKNRRNQKIKKVPFGDNRYENYHDKTGLNLYPGLVHGDKKRRRLYRARHKRWVDNNFYSPAYFSWWFLW